MVTFQQLSRIPVLVLCLFFVPPLCRGEEVASPAPTAESFQIAAPAAQTVAPQALDEEEYRQLSLRAEEPGPEVAGGALSNEHLTYAVIALATAVLILVLK